MAAYLKKDNQWIEYHSMTDREVTTVFPVPHQNPTTQQQKKENALHLHRNWIYVGEGNEIKVNNNTQKDKKTSYFFKSKYQ